MTDLANNAQPIGSARSTAYDRKFFDSMTEGSLGSARIIAPIICDLLRPAKILDVGCGRGTWLSAFIENGVQDVLGIDGDYVNRSELLIPADRFKPVDLRTPFELGARFDLAICLEVAEHLPFSRSANLVHDLTTAAPAVLFSAAVPGQDGTDHINMQWPAFWQRLFMKRGFRRLDSVRRRVLWDDRIEWWYRQNSYLFVSESLIASSTKLQEEQRLSEMNCFEVLHSDLFGKYTTLSGLLGELPGTFIRAVRRLAKGG